MNSHDLQEKLNKLSEDAKVWWEHSSTDLKEKFEGNNDKIKESFDNSMSKFEKSKQAFEEKTEEINNGIKSKWDKFTQEDLKDINGSFENFSNKIKEKYNTTKEEANANVREFMAKFH